MEQQSHYTEHLTRMANQIATFFSSMPDRDEAMLALVTHLKEFWEPRMRQAFLAEFDAGHIAGTHPFLQQALSCHRSRLD